MDNERDGVARILNHNDGTLTPQEKKILQDALYGLAPSSDRYKRIMALMGKPRESSYTSPMRDGSGDIIKADRPGPSFQGPPTADFLNPDHAVSGTPDIGRSSAHGWDAAGTPYSTDPVNDTGASQSPQDGAWTNFRGGGGLSANDVMDQSRLPNTLGEAYQPGDIIDNRPEGYATSDIAPGMLGGLRDDPRVLANLLAKSRGAGSGTAAQMLPYLQAAGDLSAQGVWGGPTNDDTIAGGPTSDAAALLQIEDVNNLMNQPGTQFINPGELYGRSFDRLENTNFDKYSDKDGQPISRDEIIDTTNNALFASAPFMTSETAAQLSGRLNQAAIDYKTKIATGEIGTISYPAYLKAMGADTWVNRDRQ